MSAATRRPVSAVTFAFLVALTAAVGLVFAAAGNAAGAAAAHHPAAVASRSSQNSTMHGGGSSSTSQGPTKSAQGIAQSVSFTTVVLKELDGSTVTIFVDSRTRILVNGKSASLGDVLPGFVVTATWQGGKAAQELDAIATVSQSGTGGSAVVQSSSSGSVVVKASDGSTVTIKVDSRTRVYLDGKSAKLGDLKRGYVLATRLDGLKRDRAASELRFLRSSH